MTKDQVTRAKELMDSIDELKKYISGVCLEIKSTHDWAYGCGKYQHKSEMVNGIKIAKVIANEIIKQIAERQIDLLRKELEILGINDNT